MTAKKRSWWQTTQKPTWGFSLGALWVILAAFQWTGLATDDDSGARSVIFGVVATVAAIIYLSSATVQLRRKRRGTA